MRNGLNNILCDTLCYTTALRVDVKLSYEPCLLPVKMFVENLGTDCLKHACCCTFRLAQELTDVSHAKAEPWIVMAYYCSSINQETKAVYFAQKVCLFFFTRASLFFFELITSLNKPA